MRRSVAAATFLFLTFHATGLALPLDLVLPTGGAGLSDTHTMRASDSCGVDLG